MNTSSLNASIIIDEPTYADWAEAIARRLCDEPLSHLRAALGDDLGALNAVSRTCIASCVALQRDSVALVNSDDYVRIMQDMTEYLADRPSLIDAMIGTYVIEDSYFSD